MAPPSPQDLLQHRAFLERLARSLVGHPQDSEDLVQGTLAHALSTSAPRRSDSLRAWLATSVRNAAANLYRDRGRRAAREAAAAREDRHEPPDVEHELEVQERVLRAVRGLREPYRTAIHLRYYSGLAPKAIAAELGVSVHTVDTRLVRGRDELRRVLSQGSGADPLLGLAPLLPLSWTAPVPPAAGTAGATTSTATVVKATRWGVWMMGLPSKVLLVGAAATVAVVAWRSGPSAPPAEPAELVRTEAARPTGDLAPPAGDAEVLSVTTEERSRVRETEAAPTAPPETTPVDAPDQRTMRGQVVDVDAFSLAAVRVRFEPDASSRTSSQPGVATTDAAGRFEIPVTGGGQFRVDDPDLTTVLAGACADEPTALTTVVIAARTVALEVAVTDETGTRVADAGVSLALPEDFRRRFDLDLDSSADVRFRARTDESGQVLWPAAPVLDGSSLTASLDGFAPATVELDAAFFRAPPPLRAELVVRHLAGRRDTLSGRVIDEHGLGIADVGVSYGLLGTRTTAEGRFFFDLTGDEAVPAFLASNAARHDLIAVRRGYLPATMRPELDALTGEPLWPRDIELQVSERPLSIAGRVVDADGEPLEDWTIFLREVHLFMDTRTVEGVASGHSDSFLHSVRSGADGRFEIGGLLDQDYDLAAMHGETLQRVDVDAVAAGTRDLTIVANTSRVWRRISGTVESLDGAALAGVVVQPFSPTQTARGTRGVWTTSAELDAVTTDAEGYFEFLNVPPTVILSLEGRDIVHREDVELPAGTAPDPDGADTLDGLRVIARMRLRLQVLLDDPSEADSFRILDEAGQELDLMTQTADSYLIRSDNSDLTDGRSRHLFVDESAAAIVLLSQGIEVRRAPLQLEVLTQNQVRL